MANRGDSTIFLGPAGSLREVPLGEQYQVAGARPTSEFFTVDGTRRVERAQRGPRMWTLPSRWMRPKEQAYLQACSQGVSTDPLYLYTNESARTNLLDERGASLADLPGSPNDFRTAKIWVPAGDASEGAFLPTLGLSYSRYGSFYPGSPLAVVKPSTTYVVSGWCTAEGASMTFSGYLPDGQTIPTGSSVTLTFTDGYIPEGPDGGALGSPVFYGAREFTTGPEQAFVALGSLGDTVTAGWLGGSPSDTSRVVGGLRLVEGTLTGEGPVLHRNGVLNPGTEAFLSGAVYRRSYVHDPQFLAFHSTPGRVGITSRGGWGTGGSGNLTLSTSWAEGGVYRSWDTPSTSFEGTGFYFTHLNVEGTGGFPVIPGEVYTLSAWSYSTLSSRTLALRAAFHDAAGAALSTAETTFLSTGATTRQAVTFTVPAGAATVQLSLEPISGPGWAAGSTFHMRGLLLERASRMLPYFDYTITPDSDFTPTAVGTPGDSESTLTYSYPNWFVNEYSYRVSSTQWSRHGTRSLRIIPTSSTQHARVRFGGSTTSLSGDYVDFEAGETYTLLASIRLAEAMAGPISAGARSIEVVYSTTAGMDDAVTLRSAPVPNVPGVYDRRLTFTLPVDAVWCAVYAVHGGYLYDSDVWFDDFAVIDGDYSGPWFDGNHAPTGYVAAWSGTASNTPNNSYSTLRLRLRDHVVPGWEPGLGTPEVVVDDPSATVTRAACAPGPRVSHAYTLREVGRFPR